MSKRRRGQSTAGRQTGIPGAFLARMERLLGAEYAAFRASFDLPPAFALRTNTLKVSAERLQALAPFPLRPLQSLPAAFLVDGGEPGKHPYHAAGLYYLQDPSAMAVAQLLDPQPGELVLDLAAAPGGKATHAAALMAHRGVLVANEIHPRRVWDLAENLERWGARNVAITNEQPERLANRLEGAFDRVLLDAPCSGEGMFRKSEAARSEWTAELVEGCALRQSGLLEQAARLVRPGGILVYSTCTFAPAEDEGVIARFLNAHTHFFLLDVEPPWGWTRGRSDWVEAAGRAPEVGKTLRLWPHLGPGEGHFVALMIREPEGEAPEPEGWRPPKPPKEARTAYDAFCAANLARAPDAGALALVGTYLYQVPPGLPDLTGLRTIHPGWWLGTVKSGRFEPAHALALGLAREEARQVLDLSADSLELRGYLRGETIRQVGEDGWVLIAVNGFPLGWGKRVQGIIKSHYPRGLRWTS